MAKSKAQNSGTESAKLGYNLHSTPGYGSRVRQVMVPVTQRIKYIMST